MNIEKAPNAGGNPNEQKKLGRKKHKRPDAEPKEEITGFVEYNKLGKKPEKSDPLVDSRVKSFLSQLNEERERDRNPRKGNGKDTPEETK